MFRFILSKQKTGKELKSVKLSQVNFDLHMTVVTDNFNKDDIAKNSTNAIETINKPPKSTKDNVKINKNEDKIKNIPKFKNINSK